MSALLVATVTFAFYVLFPVLGAYQVRLGWRRLRRWVRRAAEAPPLSFPHLQQHRTASGPYRLTGTLEAFEGRDTLWIGNDQVSLPVRLRGDVYFLEHPEEGPLPQDPPRKVPWTSLGVLPEGTHFLIWGWLSPEAPSARFEASAGRPLLVIAFSGDEKTVLERTIRDARQPIEHWNPVTPLSLVVGFGVLLLGAYFAFKVPGMRVTGLVGLALALLPSTFFLPPGIVFFYWFSRLWAKSRSLRAARDVLEFRHGQADSQSQRFGSMARAREVLAHAVLVVGAGLNALLLVTLLRWMIP